MVAHLRKRKGGFVAIESVFAMSFFLMFFFLALGFFLYIHPHTMIGKDVDALATLAERQGGLTTDDVENFKERIDNTYSFITGDFIEVSLESLEQGTDYIRDDLFDEDSVNYLERGSNELMQLIVVTPSNNEILGKVASFFNAKESLEHYQYRQVLYSERY